MDFSRRKLPGEAAEQLTQIAVGEIQPFTLMHAPIYVYLKQNEKFVSVKAPLDFFTPEELEKKSSLGSFYVPATARHARRYLDAGRLARGLMSWQLEEKLEDVTPTPYELSDAILRAIGPLWGRNAVIEPFFTALFAETLCDPLPSGVLVEARDQNVANFECAVLRSGLAVFLALHLGYCDLNFLNQLRLKVFEATVGEQIQGAHAAGESGELIRLVMELLPDPFVRAIKRETLLKRSARVAHKLAFRLKRVVDEFVDARKKPDSIYGPEGFIDA